MLVSNVDKLTKDGEVPVLLCNYVDVYKNERIRTRLPFMRATASLDEVKRFHVEVDDVLVTKDSESWTDIGVPALVEEVASDLVCGYHLAILRPFRGRASGGYLLRVLQAPSVQYQFHVQACGVTRYGLSQNAIKTAWLPLPPRDEQDAIERFLNHMDRQIRGYIRAKQRLIKLLEEQKQAIVHCAVTRGLDPNVRLKPSGFEWLGHIPEHWGVERVKEVARMESGHTPSRSNPEHWRDDNDIPWVSLNDTKQLEAADFISDTTLHINALGIQNSSAHMLPAGVVVFTRDATVGKAAITTRPMAVSQHLIAWVCGPRISNRYLLRVFYAMKAELSRFTFGATIATIGMDDVRNLVTPVPPLDEQVRIAAYLESSCDRLDLALGNIHRDLALVREYRTRLIADVVTGKLDVREAAARLPEEFEEAESVEDLDAFADAEAETDTDLAAETEEVGV
jgi:type I restriction enzyme S subunit